GDRETFVAARELCGQQSEDARILGVTILGQLGYGEGRPFADESLPIVTALCRPAEPVDVVVAAIRALGLLGRHGGAPAVLSHAGDPDEDVRLAVAQSVAGIAGDAPGDDVLTTLFALMADTSAEVRGWATFCLGSQLDVDGTAVREALLARIGDPEGEASGEALVGLARRADGRAAELVAARLHEPLDPLVVEAAARTAEPGLLPLLRALRASGAEGDEGWLDVAIDACEGKPLREP
ncbi:MAG: HEAT repeat domain-containing protein, partial [Gaiellales bacterium]